ncbi:MAG TPA: TetR/AcrR family transcriptional regulator [Spirochaetota bacterium]|nr:TetR/AcrR family transcriptional regulator [Spirochaetota bacterium]HPV42814.1 TetR/AcrR family transcriptional regulator [Spirochaetota bacterium]
MSEQKQKARNPVQKRGIETRQKIIEAAEALFAEKGYHKTNALEIAARAGVATGSFYGYFNNKKEVLIEAIRNFYSNASEKVLNVYQAQVHENNTDNYREGKNLVHFMIQSLYATHDINPALHREFIAMVLLDKEIEDINREEERKVIVAMVSLLKAYRENTRVKDIEAAAELLYRVSEEIIHRIRIIGTDIESDRLLAELEDMVCRYLLAE